MISRRALLTAPALIAGGNAFASSSSPPPVPPIGPCKFGNVQTRIPFWGSQTTRDNSTNLWTFANVFVAEADYDYVRVIYFNSDTSSHALTAVAVASSASLNDRCNPVNASGTADNTLWVPATFNNGGAAADIANSASGSTRGVTCPAGVVGSQGSNGYQPSLTFTDWVPCSSLTPIDGTNFSYIFVRTYFSASFSCLTPLPINTAPYSGPAWDAYANGRIIRTPVLNVSGDNATTPGTATAISNSNIYDPVAGIQYMSRKRGLSCLFLGDSLYQGYGTTSQQNDPFQIAAGLLSTKSFPITTAKGAYGGSQSYNFVINGYAMAKAMQPDVVFIKGESPNDSQGALATWNASLGRATAFCEWCTRQGIVPVLNTAQPWGYTGTSEANRLAYNAAVRASGWLYVDNDTVLTNGATPAVIQSQYNSVTFPLHYNDAGAMALATQAVVPVLQRIMASRPR
jgi:hypothetical protein